ncbi:hypothetical protein ASPZODRAFT_1445842 [Penicilliopsis zonata CBS 506.65]|uniref:P/Homo B domain-containing protein n=1 Tax=Penicilliopsis zonata CBS 506.65 TaxID=1073090 RepID=A0A1L9SQ94_9EURO|nr:hypothetical protein ASPZODRAFT_1445842 [Penicilliopsis zonata CBS 506.65]OJJ49296.1 hypothetical protein ASPZODRAFT_1445842 [Penicilliopsis zonata CBS 506.65]
MHFSGVTAALLGLSCAASATLDRRTYETHDFFALHLDDSTPPAQVARLLGARHEGQIGQLPGHHKFSLPRSQTSELDTLLEGLKARRKLRRRSGGDNGDGEEVGDGLDGVLWSQKLSSRQRLVKREGGDPSSKYSQISPRANRVEDAAAVAARKQAAESLAITDPIFNEQWHLFNTAELGHDLNVTGLWLEGITGKGVISAIVDDGLDMYSDDLKPNYFPKPRLFDDKHGTRCCGEIAAARNDVCGVGVAYDSKISGIRILSAPIDDADEAASINYAYHHNDIYSCSWGPPDDGKTMDAPGVLIQRAMVNGVQNGRHGKGSIYVFAAGNGASSDDNCNFDGYTNSIYSITVGAIDREGKHPSYAESCSAQMVVAYSSGSGDAIHTTDVGTNKCYSGHGGTSAAGPLAVGVMALALSIRPDLTWRDAQYLFMESAVPVNEDDGSWQVKKTGRKFSHDWGYGKVDAYTLVQLAKTWELVKPQAWYHSPWLRVQHAIPQGTQGLASSFEITAEALKKANVKRLEHVTVTMNVEHTRRGDLSLEMRSPEGIVSYLSTTRRPDNEREGYVDWTFMSVAHWGESGIGKWTVIIKDTNVNEHNGTFTDWQITLWGEAIEADNQPLHPFPDEHDHDHAIEDAIVATTSIAAGPTKTNEPSKPTDHIDRPVNAKPTPIEDASKPAVTTGTSNSTDTTSFEHFLPSFLPTFGASKRTQAWIYASLVLIIVFCLGLGVYFQIQRRKRIRNNPQDDYEFEMIQDEDDLQALTELYNAFAGESDEEVFSDDEEGPYQDRESEDGQTHENGEHPQGR